MDIVERLRKSANTVYHQDGYTFRLGLQNEAADEIERLREALKEILTHETDYEPYDCIEIARAALKEGE